MEFLASAAAKQPLFGCRLTSLREVGLRPKSHSQQFALTRD
jgi:hypothetical protein